MAGPPPGRARSRAASRSAWPAPLDSGAIYRAAAARLLESGGDPADEAGPQPRPGRSRLATWSGDGLRDRRIERAASELAAHPAVRAALLAFQRITPPRRRAP